MTELLQPELTTARSLHEAKPLNVLVEVPTSDYGQLTVGSEESLKLGSILNRSKQLLLYKGLQVYLNGLSDIDSTL
ncbi:hypothetical protein STEG23_009564, partial [Scotinomys teguina]